MICRRCKVDRPSNNFLRTTYHTDKGDILYRAKTCLPCLGRQVRKLKLERYKKITKFREDAISSLLIRIDRNDGWVNELDIVKLVDLFSELYGHQELAELDTEEELTFMRQALVYYDKNYKSENV